MPHEDCLFCKILRKEIPAKVVLESDFWLAFDDINPQAPVHALVIPKEHIASTNDLEEGDAEVMGRLFHAARLVASAKGISESGYRMVMNTGAGAGQSVFHAHLHVLGGRPLSWPPG